MKNLQKATPLDQPKRKNHRLILGPFQPDLEDELLILVKARKEADPLPPVAVLVGSNLLGLYLRRLFVLKGFDHFNLHFLTFVDFARILAGEPLNAEGLRPLPRFGDLVALRTLIEKIQLDYFQPIANRRGFQRALVSTFRDLADGGVKEIPFGIDRKLGELSNLYRLHRSDIDNAFYDETDLLVRAARELHRFPEIFCGEELILYGFYDFTQVQERLIRACAGRLDLDAFLPWRETPAFAYTSPVFGLYKELGFEIRGRRDPAKGRKPFLLQVQADLFASVQKEKKKDNDPEERSIRIIAAPGESHEVREIAREILRLARDEDIPFHEMAILVRNVDVYGPLIRQTLEDLQIPFYSQEGLPLARTLEGKSALLLLELAGSDLRRNAVMEFFTFAPVAWKRFFEEEPSPSQWDLLSREAGIVEGREQWERKLVALMGQGQEEEPAEGKRTAILAEEARRFWGFLRDFFSALDRLPKKGTWQVLADAFLHLLNTYFEANETREAIFDALRELAGLDALNREADIFLFREIAAEALEVKTLRLGSFQKSGICVSDLMPARGLSFRAVFIPGLVERAFPAPARQDPLLLDPERRAINEALGRTGRIPLKRYRFQEERLLFALAASSAGEKLILSYPRLDPTSGRERIPSFFLLRVGEALLGEPLDYSRLETLPGYRRVALSRLAPDDPDQAINEEEFDLAQVGRAVQKKDKAEAAYLKSLFPILPRAERLAQLRWGFRAFTEYDGCLKSARALQILRDRFSLSGK
ncbi:MAG: ATP-dependent nuclease subunit B-like protein, partial [Deltaproteobacteria bacterium]|nr:ATP-dependent nuclease subunit B-like protein [Deltaproteobacteria bacterium]